jgi:hypothetical protein
MLQASRRACFVIALVLIAACAGFTQTSQAILVDGPGPWQDDRWNLTATQFTSLLKDAGYTMTTIAPTDLPAALSGAFSPGSALVAAPSLASLPFDTLSAIAQFGIFGGGIMASGGEPFSNPLYLASNGAWLDAADYRAAGGSPGTLPQSASYLPTLSPWYTQYVSSSGARVPIVGSRGIAGYAGARTRVIGDVLAPAATIYSFSVPLPPGLTGQLVSGARNLNIWIAQPQLTEPYRSQLVSALEGAITGVHLQCAGANQIVWLPGESVAGEVCAVNMSARALQATLQWSISGGSGTMPQPPLSVPLDAGGANLVPLSFPSLPSGDYALSFHLMSGNQEVDRIDSPLRILDPTLSRQPSQKIQATSGAFYANGKRIYLHGVNYWPRYAAGIGANISWLEPGFYDPIQVEADLTLLESLNFNLVNIQYGFNDPTYAPQGRSLVDFLDRCRKHGIYARIAIPATVGDNAFNGTLNPSLGAALEDAYLPGNDRVFAYEVLWEPYLGMQTTGGYEGYVDGVGYPLGSRAVLDPDWRSWVNDQYGSAAAAQQSWGIAPPLDASGRLTNPTDDQIASDGAWRIMVAAYRRFLDDYLGRNLGSIVRTIRRTDPVTLITYRNWSTMTAASNLSTGYDLGTGAAHLDFLSPESYDPAPWPDRRQWGFAVAYARFRSGGKPVQWVEFGYPVGDEYGTPVTLAAQASFCDSFMRQINDDGANADSVWWWPGGLSLINHADFGIINPDGTPRGCAQSLAQWGAAFFETPPTAGTGAGAVLTIDRDSDARGQYGLFANWAGQYASARAAGQPVTLADQGLGSDTFNMPLIQVGNVAYTGDGPLKYANAELAGLHVVCPDLDVTVENGAHLEIPAAGTCQVTAAVVNTGEAQWLPTASPRGGVVLHTNSGDAALASAVSTLQSATLAPLSIGVNGDVTLTGRMRAGASEDFGEVLRLHFKVNGTRRPRLPGRPR